LKKTGPVEMGLPDTWRVVAKIMSRTQNQKEIKRRISKMGHIIWNIYKSVAFCTERQTR